MRRSAPTLALAALALAAGACDDSATEPTLAPGLTSDDLALVALDGDLLTEQAVLTEIAFFAAPTAAAAAAADETRTREFSRSRECQAGGSIEWNGTAEHTRKDDGSHELRVAGTRAQVHCTREREGRTLVVDGVGEFEAFRKRLNGHPVGPQTTSFAGSFHWIKSNGEETREGDCSYELASVRDPDRGVRTVKGFICDREIDRETEWSGGS